MIKWFDQNLNISKFKITDGRHTLKNIVLAITWQRISTSRNSVKRCKIRELWESDMKNIKLKNPRWRTTAILKIRYNKSTDYDLKNWHAEVDRTTVKILLCVKSKLFIWRWRTDAVLENIVSVITHQRIVRYRKILYDENATIMKPECYKFQTWKFNMMKDRHLENRLYHHISVKYDDILFAVADWNYKETFRR